jgi:hypothetical protein
MRILKIILLALVLIFVGFGSFEVTRFYVGTKQSERKSSETPIKKQSVQSLDANRDFGQEENQPSETVVEEKNGQNLNIAAHIPQSKRALSGIFEHNIIEDEPRDYMRWDFRTDGTVIYKLQAVENMKVSDTVVQRTIEGDGKGFYSIRNDIVTADIILIGRTSFYPSYGVEPKVSDPQTNEDIFRIDGDDLIHLSVAVIGEQTNTDNETRYIKRK